MRILFVCTLALLASCASSPFLSSWKAPDVQPLQLQGARVGAVVMMRDEAPRRAAEDALAREIGARGAVGIPGYTIVPDRKASEAEVRAAFERAGVQGIVAIRPVSVDKEVVASPVEYLDAPYRAYWDGYYGYAWNSPWIWPADAEVRTNKIVTIETLVYSLRQNKLVWAGRSHATNPRDVAAFVRNHSAAVAKELQNQGLLAEK